MKAWNTSSVPASSVLGSGALDSIQYATNISEITDIDLDADVNGRSYEGDYFHGSGIWTIPMIAANTSENAGFESATGKVSLLNTTAGTTATISATGVVSSYSLPTNLPGSTEQNNSNQEDQSQKVLSSLKNIFKSDIAFAQITVNRRSTIRAAIVNGGALPATGAEL